MQNSNLITINNEKVGVFYIEPYDETLREEPDRIKVYDSDGRYFSYIPDMEPLPLSFAKYDKIVTLLQQAKNVIEVFDIVGEPGGEFAGTKEQMIDYLHNELNWDLPREDYNPLDNEYINRFGKIYVLLYD
jgi:hypothetical protein